MKLFIKRLLTFGLTFLIIGIIGFLAPATPGVLKSLLFAQIDKDSLLVNTPAPRLVLIGGSSVSLGIDSQLLKDSLKLNPVNTAIQGSIGLKYMLDHTQHFIKRGDIVVVAPEYEQYYGNVMYGTEALLRTVMDVSRKEYKILSFKQWLNLAPFIFNYSFSKYDILSYKRSKKGTTIADYERNSFNKFGDATTHRIKKVNTIKPLPEMKNEFNIDAIKELSKFRDETQQKGATVYLAFPGIQSRSFKNNIKEINRVEKELRLNGFKMLGTPSRYELADSLLYDAPVHLNKRGADVRTKLLIQDMKACNR